MKVASARSMVCAAWWFCCWGVLATLAFSALGDGPVITEFAASNDEGLTDSEGDSSDWIELYNPTNQSVDLEGWYLTDDLADLTKWEIPEVSLAPGEYLVVFASGKNLRDPAGELHTSFSLGADGESVALVEPDGLTIASCYRDYPPQLADITYGTGGGAVVSQTETLLIGDGAVAKALIPTSATLGLTWIQAAFNDSSWLTGTTGVGYDYAGYTGLDVAAMQGRNQTVYVRIPFMATKTTDIDKLVLRMRYEDGFVAWLNGREVARANAPATSQLAWNSGATATREDADAVVFQEFDITACKTSLVKGSNVLAVQGLNSSLSSSDLLIQPELAIVQMQQVSVAVVSEGYLAKPTPGGPNESPLVQAGPVVRNVTKDPPAPSPGANLVITAEVNSTGSAIAEVELMYRVNYLVDSRMLPSGGLPMLDDGKGADAAAGDGVYTAIIPGQVVAAGRMIRWYVRAVDAQGNAFRNPPFAHPKGSPEYYGTVVQDSSVRSSLPVMCWFVENVSASETSSGTRGSLYYLGEFYDNVAIHTRGGSTEGAPKKHFKFKMNKGYKVRYRDGAERVDEFNLNSTYSDKAYVRQPLAFEAYDWCGCPGSESFPVRAQRNGQFYGVQAFIEEPEEELLEREGLDPRGALYKMYNTFYAGGGAEKKSRQWEGRQDLDDFCNSINNSSGSTRHINLFDRVNLPLTLDYLAATVLVHQNDHPHKNHYLYRDSEGSGQWCFLPWDHDLTWGSNWIGDQGGSYGDVIYANDDQVPGRGANVKPSHPFVGKEDCREWNNNWNRLTDALLNDATVREMYLRRLRTVMDDFLQPPGTPYDGLFIENRIDELIASMAQDVALDYARWANPWSWGGQEGYPRDQSFTYAINVLKTDYLAVRRAHLYLTHNVDRVALYKIAGSYSAAIPNAQPAEAAIEFGAYEYNPSSGNQDEEYIELKNPNAYAVDLTGWRLSGGVEHAFLPGTVLVAGGKMYVSPNAAAFRSRATTPRGGQGLFVQGDYKGHLSNWGETVDLVDRSGRTVDTLTYVGMPSDQQRGLRITEILYNPAPGGGYPAQTCEFIELKNVGPTTLTLDGAKLTEGVSYTFQQGANVKLTPGACIVIARDRAAFTARYGASVRLATGVFTGNLDNAGEKIKLEDRTNNTILEFKYKDSWKPETDGLGFSLTIKDAANADLDSWDKGSAWQASSQQGGSPGS